MNALETMALTEKQQKVQICEGKNNLVKIIVGVKRAEKRKWMNLAWIVKESSKKKLVSRTRAGFVEKMADEKLVMRAGSQKVEGKWR